MMLEQRTICLIPIPFTELNTTKKRPVVIISNNKYNTKTEDILVMAITSNIKDKKYSILITNEHMEEGTLLKNSIIRVDKIYSINKSLVVKEFGKINKSKFNDVINKLFEFLKNSEEN